MNLCSLSFEGDVHIDLSKRTEMKEKHWGDYARGAKYALQKRFELTPGIDGVLQGSLPVGGLSSSAAVLAYQNAPLKTFDKTFLRDIPKETFDNIRDMMPLRFAKRAEHFYSEYRRVRQGVTAWESGNLLPAWASSPKTSPSHS